MSGTHIATIVHSATGGESVAARILQAALAIKAAGEAVVQRGENARQTFLALRGQLEERKAAVRELALVTNTALDEAKTLRLSLEYIESGLAVPGDHVAEGQALLAEAVRELAVLEKRIESLRIDAGAARNDCERLSHEIDSLKGTPAVAELLKEESRRESEQAAREAERHQSLRDARRAPSAIERFIGLVEIQERFGGNDLAGEIESVAGAVMGDARSASRRSGHEALSGLAALAVVHGKLQESSALRQQVFGLFATIANTQGLYVSRRGFPLAAAELSDGSAVIVASAGGKGFEVGALADTRAFRACDRRGPVVQPVDPRLAPLAAALKARPDATARPVSPNLVLSEVSNDSPGALAEMAGTKSTAMNAIADLTEGEVAWTIDEEALKAATRALAEHFAPPTAGGREERVEKTGGAPAQPVSEAKSAAALREIGRKRIDNKVEGLGNALTGRPHAVDVRAAAIALVGWDPEEMDALVARGLEMADGSLLTEGALIEAAMACKPGWQPAPAFPGSEVVPQSSGNGRKRARKAAARMEEEAVAA